MHADPPIACSLTATELPVRLAEIAALGRAALMDASLAGRRAVLRFSADPGVAERVHAIVAAESACCAFLTLRVDAEPDAIVLQIDGPAGAEPVLAELVKAFGSEAA